jgi:hypothetical protein
MLRLQQDVRRAAFRCAAEFIQEPCPHDKAKHSDWAQRYGAWSVTEVADLWIDKLTVAACSLFDGEHLDPVAQVETHTAEERDALAFWQMAIRLAHAREVSRLLAADRPVAEGQRLSASMALSDCDSLFYLIRHLLFVDDDRFTARRHALRVVGERLVDANWCEPPGADASRQEVLRTLRAYAVRELKGQEQTAVKYLCDRDGSVPLADLKGKLRYSEDEWKSGWDGLRKRLNPKLREAVPGHPFRLCRRKNQATLVGANAAN